MIRTFLSNECCFLRLNFTKKHYTDNRKGAPYHYVARLTKGRGRLRCMGETISLNVGDVFYIPKNIPYESFWSGEEIEWYSFGFSYFPEAEQTDIRIQKIACDDGLKEEITSLPVGNRMTSGSLSSFYGVLARLIPYMSTDARGGEESVFKKAKSLMENHTDWSLSEIARKCNISYSTLYAVCKTICGKTPSIIRQEVLVQRAIMLLSTTDQSVQEISDALGFSSTSYFRKILKQHTSYTPTQIRKNRNNMF